MDETAVRELLDLAASDPDAPPCEVSIALARSRGRRRLRLHRIYLPGAAPVAAAVAVVLIVTLSTALGGGTPGRGLGPARPRLGGPAVAPTTFNALVPYASFGWLPAGFSASAAGVTDSATSHSVTLQAQAPTSDGRMVTATVDTAGACRIVPTASALAGPKRRRMESILSTTAAPARSLSCTDPSPDGENRLAELASAAPDVNGLPAYWTPQGALEWQYAPGAWAEMAPMVSPEACASGAARPACMRGNLAGWVNVPAAAASAAAARERTPSGAPVDVRPEAQSTASKSLLLKIATSLHYGDTTPLVFGFELATLPAGWQPAANYSYAPVAGRLVATGWSAGPAVDPTALSVSIGSAVAANSDYACKFIAGQSTTVTLRGEPAALRTLDEPDKHWQSLCANDVDGVQPYLTLDLNTPGTNAPLPGSGQFGSLLTVFDSMRLLGPDPAAWTTNPLS